MKGRPHLNVVLQIALLILVGCGGVATSDTGNGKGQVEKEVRAMMKQYYADVKKSGLKAEFGYLDHSDAFFWIPPGYQSAISYDSVAAILNRNASSLRMIDNHIDSLTVIPMTDSLAAYHALITSVVMDTAGVVSRAKLLESGVVINRNGKWRLLNGHTSVLN